MHARLLQRLLVVTCLALLASACSENGGTSTSAPTAANATGATTTAPPMASVKATTADAAVEQYIAKLEKELRRGMTQTEVDSLLDLFPDKVEYRPGGERLRPSDPEPPELWIVEYDLRPNVGITTAADLGFDSKLLEAESSKYPRLICTFDGIAEVQVENTGPLGIPTKEEMLRNLDRAIGGRKLLKWEILRRQAKLSDLLK